MQPTPKYYEWRAAEIFRLKPEVVRCMRDEDKAELITYAMIRHSEESEMLALLMQAVIGGRVASG